MHAIKNQNRHIPGYGFWVFITARCELEGAPRVPGPPTLGPHGQGLLRSGKLNLSQHPMQSVKWPSIPSP